MLFLLKPREDTKVEAIFFFLLSIDRRIWNFIIFWNIVEGFDEGIAHGHCSLLKQQENIHLKCSFYIIQRKKTVKNISTLLLFIVWIFVDQPLLTVCSNFLQMLFAI